VQVLFQEEANIWIFTFGEKTGYRFIFKKKRIFGFSPLGKKRSAGSFPKRSEDSDLHLWVKNGVQGRSPCCARISLVGWN